MQLVWEGAMAEFFNNIKTQIAIMDSLLFYALLSLLCIVACMLLINMIKNIAKNEDKFKMQIMPVVIFILLMGIVVLLAVCRFA